ERELTRQRRETIQAPFGVAVFHFEVAPLDVAEVAHPEQKLAAQVDRYRVRPPRRIEIAEPHDFRLLRVRRKRPCSSRAAEERDELAPFHSITSSARKSTEGGMVRSRDFAVLRFTANSNFVGCSTGRSAGLTPLRTLATMIADCRHIAARLGP